MQLLFYVASGGALGAAVRYLVALGLQSALGEGRLPLATLAVNVAGCFAAGLLLAFAERSPPGLSPGGRAFLLTGILGGFTTFSAFGVDTLQFARRGEWGAALWYAGASVAMSLLAAGAGFWLAAPAENAR